MEANINMNNTPVADTWFTNATWHHRSMKIAPMTRVVSELKVRANKFKVAQAVAPDRDQYINDLAKDVIDAQEPKAYSKRWPAIKRLAPAMNKKGGPAAIPMLMLHDGSYAQDFVEAADRRTQHWSDFEKGFPSDFNAILSSCRNIRYNNDRIFPQLDISCLITLIGLETKLRDVNPDKAVGPDDVPPAIPAMAPCEMARLLLPISMKCCGLVAEPFQWAGGRYKELFKRSGVHHLADNFRAILLADIMGKTVQGALRSKVIDFTNDFLGDYKFAGRPKRGCDLAFSYRKEHAR